MSSQPAPSETPTYPAVPGTGGPPAPTYAPPPPASAPPQDRLAVWLQFPRRTVFLLIAIFLSWIVIFALCHTGYGGPLTLARPVPSEVAEELAQRYGLDQPLLVQFFNWLGGAFRGDFGTSLLARRPAGEMIADLLPNTLLLLGAGLALALLWALVSSLIGALVHHLEQAAGPVGSVLKGLGRLLAFIQAAAPAFCLGAILLLVLAVQLEWFPMGGLLDPRTGGDFADRLKHLILPAVTLASLPSILTGQALTREMTLPGRPTGRRWLIGLFKWPGATLGQIGGVLSALVLVETVFSWPGIGRLFFQAAMTSDTALLSGVLFVLTIIILVGRWLAEGFRWLERIFELPAGEPQPTPWRRTARKVYVIAALALLLIPLGFALAGLATPYDSAIRRDMQAIKDPGPSADHPWGTDRLGRDLRALTLRGSLTSLGAAGVAAAIILIPSGLAGALTGWLASRRRFWSDSVADALLLPADALLFIPAAAVAIAVGLRLREPLSKAGASSWILVAVIAAIVLLPRAFRVYQDLWRAAPGRDKVLILGLAGTGALLLSTLFASFGLIAAVDFVGFGTVPPIPSLGTAMGLNYSAMRAYPAQILAPGLILWTCALALYTAADALIGYFRSKEVMARLNE